MTAVLIDRADLLARIDLAGLFDALGLPAGRNRQHPCPSPTHAQSGATPPVSIGGRNGGHLWHCHGCDAGGTAVDLVAAVHGVGAGDALRWLTERYGAVQAAPLPPVARSMPPDPERGRLDGPQADEVLAQILAARGWNAEVVDVFGLYLVRNRPQGVAVRFPYRTGGQVRWWQDRAVADDVSKPKWLAPPGMARTLYAADLEAALDRAVERGIVWVTEGPADAVALWHAFPDAAVIAIPGTEGVGRWAPALAGLDVIVATDPDPAGDRAATELANLVASTGGRTARLRGPSDLDDWRRALGCDDDRFGEAIAEALDSEDWTGGPT